MPISSAAPNAHAEIHDTSVAIDTWLTQHAVAMLAATLIGAALGTAAPIALVGAISFALCAFRNRGVLAQLRPYGGYANHLTALRLAAILCAAALLTEISREWLLLIFGANVVLDVADGYAARRKAEVTPLGTMFDREADAVFVLVAYLYFFCVANVGAWILLPGLLPYLYRLFVRAVRAAPTGQTKERLATILAGANYVCVLLALAVPAPAQTSVLALSTAIVLVSFGVSLWKLYRDEHSIS